jgi:hypothetical protein
MGLTVHWSWNTDFSRERVREVVRKLFEFASSLGFEHCFEPVEIDWSKEPADDDEKFLRSHSHWTACHQYETDGIPEGTGELIEPAWSICFFAADPGTEPAFFGFGEYPAIWRWRGQELPTGAKGLSWMDFCKTQYASMPQDGGEDNFIAAHLRIVKVLDEAVRLGVPVDVTDEGEYWDTRDEERLLAKLRQYNGSIAGFAGHLKDRLGNDAVEAPIRDHPEFERLEAKGNEEFGDKFKQADEAVRDMLKQNKDNTK